MTHARTRAVFALVVAGATLLAACGSSSKSSSSTTTTPPTAAATTVTTSPTASSAAGPTQTLAVTPSSGLTDGQTVQLKGAGFTKAGETLQALECADKGTQTGAGDCDLKNIKVLGQADSSGAITGSYTVHKGPFGSNNIVCSATVKCLISVSTAGSPQPDQVGTENITFSS
jgi:hypothetical protein